MVGVVPDWFRGFRGMQFWFSSVGRVADFLRGVGHGQFVVVWPFIVVHVLGGARLIVDFEIPDVRYQYGLVDGYSLFYF